MLHCHLSRLSLYVALLPILIGSSCNNITYPSCKNVALLPITPYTIGPIEGYAQGSPKKAISLVYSRLLVSYPSLKTRFRTVPSR